MEDNQEFGVVKSREGKVYTLELGNNSGCHGCLLAGVCNRQGKIVKVNSDLEMEIGEKVSLEVKASDRILSSFVVFVVPIILMICFYFLGGLFLDGQTKPTFFSFLGLILGALVIRFVDKRAKIEVEITK